MNPTRMRDRIAVEARRQRLARGLTQADVTERMVARGFEWVFSTLSKVESGTRSLLVDEAHALLGELGLTLDEVCDEGSEPDEPRLARALEDVLRRYREGGLS